MHYFLNEKNIIKTNKKTSLKLLNRTKVTQTIKNLLAMQETWV